MLPWGSIDWLQVGRDLARLKLKTFMTIDTPNDFIVLQLGDFKNILDSYKSRKP
jgi:hypothetical protein